MTSSHGAGITHFEQEVPQTARFQEGGKGRGNQPSPLNDKQHIFTIIMKHAQHLTKRIVTACYLTRQREISSPFPATLVFPLSFWDSKWQREALFRICSIWGMCLVGPTAAQQGLASPSFNVTQFPKAQGPIQVLLLFPTKSNFLRIHLSEPGSFWQVAYGPIS